jgi:hypothetical protein
MMLKQEITVWAALTIGSASVYHLIRGNVVNTGVGAIALVRCSVP